MACHFAGLLFRLAEGSQTFRRWIGELKCVEKKKMSAALVSENKTPQEHAHNVSDVFPMAIPAYKTIRAATEF